MSVYIILFVLLILLRVLWPAVGSLVWRIVLVGLSFPVFTFAGGWIMWWIFCGGEYSQTCVEDLLKYTIWCGLPCGFFGSFILKHALLTGSTLHSD